MSKLNIIQRRELEPLIIKAGRIAKHYENASNCACNVSSADGSNTASLTGTGIESENNFKAICAGCREFDDEKNNAEKNRAVKTSCAILHREANEKAVKIGGSYIYICCKGVAFWTSPFYSGERLAGSLLSGGLKISEHNSDRVKSLAQMMLLCANQISGMSFIQKNVVYMPLQADKKEADKKYKNVTINKDNIKDISHNENDGIYSKNSSQIKQKSKKLFCPIDMERKLLASLRRGDKEEGQKILVDLLEYQYREINANTPAGAHFPVFRLKALELAVLLSRAVVNPKDIKDNSFLETTNRLFKKIEESASFEEISETLKTITERMSRMIFSFHGVRHFSALRKAERYIWENYTRKLSLKEIAAASGLSAPYFSTVFKDEMGENLSNYLNRLRVEKAATMLTTTDISISEIAVSCGFEDQSWFSKIFRNNTGYTPGKYRECGIVSGGMYAEGNILR